MSNTECKDRLSIQCFLNTGDLQIWDPISLDPASRNGTSKRNLSCVGAVCEARKMIMIAMYYLCNLWMVGGLTTADLL